jgi:hypothetical protein
MLECTIGNAGAKRIGEMFEKNASIMEIDLKGGCPLNLCFSSVVIIACFPHTFPRGQLWFTEGILMVLLLSLLPLFDCRECED